jgi:choline-sulfatase
MGKKNSSRLWRWSLAFRVLIACMFTAGMPKLFAEQKSASPSVILISVDTLRADRLSCYGYRNLRTPNIDAIARGGTLFYQAGAQAPLTLPSHVSFLTSTYPFANGVEDNGHQLGRDAVTLATVLKSRGYRTAAFVGGFVLDRRFGLNQGFDLYDSPFDLHRGTGQDPGDIKRPGEDVVRAARRWLDENSTQPFFLFLHLYDLHTPYTLPPRWQKRSQGSGYEAALGYVDEVLGSFCKYLSEQGLLKRSLVVFTSDHGESLGEHGESTHGYFIYQSTLWVPLIFHWPGEAGAYPTRANEPVSLLDLAPTILQIVGVPSPPQFQGRSFLGLLSPKSPKAEGEVYGESLYGHTHFGVSSLRSLRLGGYKYIEAPRPEFYDLTGDPGESRNLYQNKKALALAFRERLQSIRSRFQSEHQTESQALSPEAIAKLSSLGYVAVSGAHSGSSEAGPDPKDRIAEYEQYGRAILLASSGRLEGANELLRELLVKDSGLLDVRISLGLNQQKMGQHTEAVQNFQQVLERNPLNVLAHFNLGVSYFQLQRLEEAVKELEAALVIAPYYTRAEELLGTIWLQKKDYPKARGHFDHMLTISPGDFGAHYNLGAMATLEGRWEDGVRHLRAALQADPQSAEVHNTLGSLYLRRGELEKARGELAEAVRLQPKFAWAHYNLGLVFRQQKKGEEAAHAFRQALASDPGFGPAKEALDRLESSRGQP